DIGVLPYYTFTTKGYLENRELFTPNARSVQEQVEEKSIGRVDLRYHSSLRRFIPNAQTIIQRIDALRQADEIPFLATDRNMLNLPGVGKSNSFRMIGITADGRRILEFEFDRTRAHSPVIEKIGMMVVVESKSIAHYLRQLEAMGEDIGDYASIWGYSAGHVERRSPVFDPGPLEMATGRSPTEALGIPD
ncbi:MAG: KamA family protein, partial [Actinomycetes bacterium]|nr:KamA family protein [Actinomycetes bacterium]